MLEQSIIDLSESIITFLPFCILLLLSISLSFLSLSLFPVDSFWLEVVAVIFSPLTSLFNETDPTVLFMFCSFVCYFPLLLSLLYSILSFTVFIEDKISPILVHLMDISNLDDFRIEAVTVSYWHSIHWHIPSSSLLFTLFNGKKFSTPSTFFFYNHPLRNQLSSILLSCLSISLDCVNVLTLSYLKCLPCFVQKPRKEKSGRESTISIRNAAAWSVDPWKTWVVRCVLLCSMLYSEFKILNNS